MFANDPRPLRICLLSYRSNPHCGGQGIYVQNLSRALKALGHQVEVVSGPPEPILAKGIPLHRIQSLDLYNPDNLFRMPTLKELSDPINLMEWLSVSTMGFPEPFTFGLRVCKYLKDKLNQFDIVHDNQSLSYGIRTIHKYLPTITTIHHPITVDRDLAVKAASSVWKKIQQMRWYSFISMQKRVARIFSHIITVSRSAGKDISRAFNLPFQKFRIIPNGIRTDLFYPIPEIQREKNRIMVTSSADTPLKGLFYLLQAVAQISQNRRIRLVIVGKPPQNGAVQEMINRLGIGKYITFTGRIDNDVYVQHYARASLAVVPSVYEGFGLPAGEAMACGVPVVSTTGGALPEVVGNAGLLVPPADTEALANAIISILDHPDRARQMGHNGYERVRRQFTWEKAAELTIEAYRETIHDHRRFQQAEH
jgi:glycosyltransferase involved in cell wall biosynthesis